MPPTDEDTAIAAITALSEYSDKQKTAHSKINEILKDEDANPFIDIHELFSLYNVLYFRSLLLPRVEVSWSPRLTLCAGICELVKDEEGKYRRIRLKLSEPLLKYRSRSDTVNTLLHEAIHAYFFITTSWHHSRGDDGTGHGKGFLLLADAISSHGDYEITVYHTFHDEVDSYRTHIWACDGPCQRQPPYFGFVKRSMNRPPGKSDSWWKKHEEECGGTYTKVQEPELTKAQVKAMSAKERAGRQKNKIDNWVKASAVHGKHSIDDRTSVNLGSDQTQRWIATTSISDTAVIVNASPADSLAGSRKRRPSSDIEVPKRLTISCPICDMRMTEHEINDHLDKQHLT